RARGSRQAPPCGPHGLTASLNADRTWRRLASASSCALLSFERPAAEAPRLRPRRTLKTAQLAKQRKITVVTGGRAQAQKPAINDHRQDSKGTRWMPWHQESKK